MLSCKECPHEWTNTLSKKHTSCHLCSEQYCKDFLIKTYGIKEENPPIIILEKELVSH
jgi:hypothetical protein